MIKAEFYSPELIDVWNDFIEDAVNGHFMFNRNFMEYHSDRFRDASVLLFGENGILQGVFPANKSERTIFSHQGLTFGGMVYSKRLNIRGVMAAFDCLIDFFRLHDYERIVYKRIPGFYTASLAQDDLYALFKVGANLYRRDISSTIDLSTKYSYTKGRKWSVNKGRKNGISIVEDVCWPEFWEILNSVLIERHGVKAVHSIAEIMKLKTSFPENIKLFTANKDDEVLAGGLLFIDKNVVHTQYLANSCRGRDLGALDYLIDFLLGKYSAEKRYFDFGISTEKEGRVINEGLLAQKEGFGARCTVHDFYEIELK